MPHSAIFFRENAAKTPRKHRENMAKIRFCEFSGSGINKRFCPEYSPLIFIRLMLVEVFVQLAISINPPATDINISMVNILDKISYLCHRQKITRILFLPCFCGVFAVFSRKKIAKCGILEDQAVKNVNYVTLRDDNV